MFGDKLLVGQYNYNLDNKNRICLPPNSGREQNDITYLCYDKELEVYTIYPGKIIQHKINDLQKKVDEAKSAQELKQYKLMLLEFSTSIIKECTVDGSGRIILGSEFSQFQNFDIIGVGNHLILKPIDKNKKK